MTSTTSTILFVFLVLAVSEHASATCPTWNDTNAVVVESPAGDKCYLLPAGHNRGVWSSTCALCWMYAYTSLGGGQLPFVANAFENAFVRNLTAHAPMDVGEYLWLGGEWVRGKYRWQDGTPFTYTNWAQGEPKASFVMMNVHTGQWHTQNWDGTYNGGFAYMCEIPRVGEDYEPLPLGSCYQ